jgi:hypothetical protein
MSRSWSQHTFLVSIVCDLIGPWDAGWLMYRSLKSTEERLVKKLMRLRTCSISGALRAVLDSESGLFAFRLLLT